MALFRFRSLNRTTRAYVAIAVSGALLLALTYFAFNNWKQRRFQETLRGDIVFLRRVDGDLSIHTISAAGGKPTLVFRNTDPNVLNTNVLYPRWTHEGRVQFAAMDSEYDENMNPWKRWEVEADGRNPRIVEASHTGTSLVVRNDDFEVSEGDVYLVRGDAKSLVYDFKGYFPDINRGASEVSWSPDKHYVLFQACPWFRTCGIYVADRTGKNVVRITSGTDPDWKY